MNRIRPEVIPDHRDVMLNHSLLKLKIKEP